MPENKYKVTAEMSESDFKEWQKNWQELKLLREENSNLREELKKFKGMTIIQFIKLKINYLLRNIR